MSTSLFARGCSWDWCKSGEFLLGERRGSVRYGAWLAGRFHTLISMTMLHVTMLQVTIIPYYIFSVFDRCITDTWGLGSLQNTENEANLLLLPLVIQKLKTFQLQGAWPPDPLTPPQTLLYARAPLAMCSPHIFFTWRRPWQQVSHIRAFDWCMPKSIALDDLEGHYAICTLFQNICVFRSRPRKFEWR